MFDFIYIDDWRKVPGASSAHLAVPGNAGVFQPPAPTPIPHKGFPVLRVPFASHELIFCSCAHLDHTIDVLSMSPMPTSRQLSARMGPHAPLNSLWLSRFPKDLKAPRQRQKVVRALQQARAFLIENFPTPAFQPSAKTERIPPASGPTCLLE